MKRLVLGLLACAAYVAGSAVRACVHGFGRSIVCGRIWVGGCSRWLLCGGVQVSVVLRHEEDAMKAAWVRTGWEMVGRFGGGDRH